jgi:hypothetical protein
MPFDRNDPRDESLDHPSEAGALREADEDDLAGSLGALFEMFGGDVLEPSPRD